MGGERDDKQNLINDAARMREELKMRRPPRMQEIMQLKLPDKLLISSKDQEIERINSTRSMEDSKKQRTISKITLMRLRNSREEEMKTMIMSMQNWLMLKERPKD